MPTTNEQDQPPTRPVPTSRTRPRRPLGGGQRADADAGSAQPAAPDTGPATESGDPETGEVESGAAEVGAAAVGASAAAPDAAAVEEPLPVDDEQAVHGGFQVRLDNFEGPFDLLLKLISKHQLDVTEVALSRVTDEFIAHIREGESAAELDQTTEFLVVAATLLDLKAARLLPAAEVESEEDLALLEARDLLFARLLQYRAYKRIADIFAQRWERENHRHPRTVGLEPRHAALLPEVVISVGPRRLAELAARALTPKKPPEVYVDHIHMPLVSVQEEGEYLVARLRALGDASFTELVADAADTLTIVARFLSLLELYRDSAVTFDQPEALGPLWVHWVGVEEHVPTVTDEFDSPAQPPGQDGPAGQGEPPEQRGSSRARGRSATPKENEFG